MKKEIRNRYPENWKLISAKIQFERAHNRCEMCNLRNGILIKRNQHNGYRYATPSEHASVRNMMMDYKMSMKSALHKLQLTQVILAVAHLDHDEKNNDPKNLMCLCQKCHLRHDKQDNMIRAKILKPYPDLSLFGPQNITS